MAAYPPDLPGSAMRLAMDAARRNAAAGSSLPPPLPRHTLPSRTPGTPPPLPTRLFATLQESAEAMAEKLQVKRASMLLDEGELARFKNLIIFAKTAVESRFQGRHKSPDIGGGGEFSEYQSYDPDRSVQAIDWHVYARSRKLVIRRYQVETDMDVHLLVDASGSMAYRGGKREEKGHRAARIAAALAYLMLKQGDKASITLFADRVLEHIPSGGTRRHLMAMLRALVRPAHAASGPTNLPAAIAECERLVRRRGRLVVLSDFLGHEPQVVIDALAPFSHRGFEILLMQLTDPDEMTLPDAPLARFVDMETGESIEVEPSEIRAEYEERMRARTRAFAAGGALHRMDFTALDTASPYRDAIEAYLGFRRRKALTRSSPRALPQCLAALALVAIGGHSRAHPLAEPALPQEVRVLIHRRHPPHHGRAIARFPLAPLADAPAAHLCADRVVVSISETGRHHPQPPPKPQNET